MAETDQSRSENAPSCGCFSIPGQFLVTMKELGMDASYAEITLLVCSVCGQQWLRYFYELEAFTASGRWYLGAIQAEQAAQLTPGNAKATFSSLGWYFYGGSYFWGQTGKTSGRI